MIVRAMPPRRLCRRRTHCSTRIPRAAHICEKIRRHSDTHHPGVSYRFVCILCARAASRRIPARYQRTAMQRTMPNDAAPPMARLRRPWPDSLVSVIVGLTVLAVLLALRPVVGMPMNDDFSYARTADAFARTGHIVYNGWGSPMLLPQTYFGALLFRLFGFSYYVTQWSGIVCAAVTAGALYAFARACTLRRPAAAAFTCLLALNPIYLGVAPTFMTDIPSLLFLLLMVLALVRGLRGAAGAKTQAGEFLDDGAPSAGAVDWRWLVAAVALGLIGGSDRQILWVEAAGVLGTVAFLVPKARTICVIGVVLQVVAALAGSAWFDRQPYSVPSDTGLADTVTLFIGFPDALLMLMYHVWNLIGLFVFGPAAAALLLQVVSGRRVRWLLFIAVAVFSFFPIVHPLGKGQYLALYTDHYYLTALPYGQYFTDRGSIIGAVYGWTQLPHALGGFAVRILVLLGALGMTFGGYLLLAWPDDLREMRGSQQGRLTLAQVIASAAAAGSVSQILISLPWFAVLNMFDRYLVLELPGLLLLHLLQAQSAWDAARTAGRFATTRGRAGAAAGIAALVITALLIAAFGVTFADDYFAVTRARATLYRRLVASGIPETAIHAGFEPAADDQVRLTGHMNNSHVRNPPNAHIDVSPDGIDSQTATTPTLKPRYLVSTIAPPDMPAALNADPTPVDSETYRTPLPPGKRTLYVYRLLGAPAGS